MCNAGKSIVSVAYRGKGTLWTRVQQDMNERGGPFSRTRKSSGKGVEGTGETVCIGRLYGTPVENKKTKGDKHDYERRVPPMSTHTPYNPIFRSSLGTCPISVYFPPVR